MCLKIWRVPLPSLNIGFYSLNKFINEYLPCTLHQFLVLFTLQHLEIDHNDLKKKRLNNTIKRWAVTVGTTTCLVIKAERRVLKELGFSVHVKHPHKVCII
jgi:hypothetical protein